MMESKEFWKKFEKTGDIRDYLNFTACTSESEQVEQQTESQYDTSLVQEKETKDDRFYDCDWDSFSNHTDW